MCLSKHQNLTHHGLLYGQPYYNCVLTFNITLEDQVNYLLQLHSLKTSYGLDVEIGPGVCWVD